MSQMSNVEGFVSEDVELTFPVDYDFFVAKFRCPYSRANKGKDKLHA